MLLSELGPVIGEQVFKQLHARKKARGREKNSNVNYRALAAKWDAFRSYHCHRHQLDEANVAKRFLREFRQLIGRLGIKVGSYDVLRHAAARGRQARESTKAHREREWRIVPTFSLVDAIHGRHSRLVCDVRTYHALKAAAEHALLGKI
jgi:hypothetical protein